MLMRSPVDVALFELGFRLSFSDPSRAMFTTHPNTGFFCCSGLDFNKFSDVTDVRSLASLLGLVCNFNELGTEMEW